MNNVDLWVKLIIPGVFLVIWAINQLINKEATALQNRGMGLGPRPGGLPPGVQPREGPVTSLGREAPRGREDDIVIIRAENVRPVLGNPPSAAARRAAGRGRAQARAPKREEPPSTQRLIGNRLASEVSQPVGLKIDVRPLTEYQPATQATSSGQGSTQTQVTIGLLTNPTADSARRALIDRERVREAFVLNELLQPPLTMRRPRRM